MTRAKDISKIVTDADLSGTLDVAGDVNLSANLNLGDNDKAIFGAGSDLEIFHDGSNSYIKESGTGQLVVRAEDLRLQDAGGTNWLQGDTNGAVRLYHNGSNKLATTSTGIDVTGTATMDGLILDNAGGINSDVTNLSLTVAGGNADTSGGNITLYGSGSGAGSRIRFRSDSTERMRIENNGNISFYEDTGTTPKLFWDASTERLGIGTTSPDDAITIQASSGMIKMIDEQNTNVYHRIYSASNSSLVISADAGNANSGQLHFYTTGTERMRIDSSGNLLVGTTTKEDYRNEFAQLQNHGGGIAGAIAAVNTSDTDGTSGFISIKKYSSGSVPNGYGLGSLIFAGADGSGTHFGAAEIKGAVDGTSGTGDLPGRLMFLTASDGASSVTERMRIDSGGHILFGTTTLPTTGGGAGFDPDNNGRMVLHLGSNSTDQKDLITLKDSNGVVGAIQTVGGSIAIDVNELRVNHGAGSSDNTTFRITGGTSGLSSLQFADTSDGNVGMLQYNHSSNYLLFQVNNAERVRIDSSGRVGIGVVPNVSPGGSRLGVQISNGSNGALISLSNNASESNNPRIFSNSADLGFATGVSGSGVMQFYTNNTERMRIRHDGWVTITDDPANVPNNADGTGFNQNGRIVNRCDVDWNLELYGNQQGRVRLFAADGSGTQVGSITCSNSATAYATSSDHRLKENVTADWDATTRLKQLNPVRFNFIADADTTVDGFLAHEVQSVVPEAITGTHNEVDADGNPVYQGIDQSKLVPLLVKTIQELEARIVALETA